jgi:hypothetical protein
VRRDVPRWDDLKLPTPGDDIAVPQRLTAGMELITAIVLAGPLGYFGRSRKQGLGLYLVAWAVIFPIQTIVVHSENPDDIVVVYFVFNACILAGGIALNTLGAWLRRRRASTVSARS